MIDNWALIKNPRALVSTKGYNVFQISYCREKCLKLTMRSVSDSQTRVHIAIMEGTLKNPAVQTVTPPNKWNKILWIFDLSQVIPLVPESQNQCEFIGGSPLLPNMGLWVHAPTSLCSCTNTHTCIYDSWGLGYRVSGVLGQRQEGR